MAIIFIPSLLRDLTAGVQSVRVSARNADAAIAALDVQFPGMKARLMKGDRLRPGLMLVVDGHQAEDGLRTRLNAKSEVHFVPSLAGGLARCA